MAVNQKHALGWKWEKKWEKKWERKGKGRATTDGMKALALEESGDRPHMKVVSLRGFILVLVIRSNF